MKFGDDKFKGMKIFKVQCDHLGIPHEGGALYAVFDNGWLVGEYFTERNAEQAFINEVPRQNIHLKDYEGIDRRLR
jgi:hypothetical protein